MRHLLLLRHAKSDWDDPRISDFDRPLTDRGNKEAPFVGKELEKRGVLPDTIFCSSALRTRQTIIAVMESGHFEGQLIYCNDLYGATADQIMDKVHHIPDSAMCVLFCGHNPGMEELLGRLTGSCAIMTTACLACIALNRDHWGDTADGDGELKWKISGKELAT